MRTITVDEIRTAYQKTGLGIERGYHYRTGPDGEICAGCALFTLAAHEDKSILENVLGLSYHVNLNPMIDKILGLDWWYSLGFRDGWDGNEERDRQFMERVIELYKQDPLNDILDLEYNKLGAVRDRYLKGRKDGINVVDSILPPKKRSACQT
jgi:hypothetical protein